MVRLSGLPCQFTPQDCVYHFSWLIIQAPLAMPICLILLDIILRFFAVFCAICENYPDMYTRMVLSFLLNIKQQEIISLFPDKNDKWQRGDLKNIVPPGAFLPAAERYNLISKPDHWVIKNGFGLFAENPEFLKKINFCSINLSGQSLVDDTFLDFIVTKLNASGIDGEKICFEITETAAISNLNTAIKFISTLKALGCRFALDDFGSGLSSFGYLKNLPVDYLKIDGMFVKDIVDDPIDHAMVKSINEIGQVMGMQTIAEFVENDVIKGMLKEIGVNYGQGFGIGKPLLLDELLRKSRNPGSSDQIT